MNEIVCSWPDNPGRHHKKIGVKAVYRFCQRVLVSALLSSCFFIGDLAYAENLNNENVYKDVWERSNRRIYKFNSAVDGAVLKPVARVAKFVTPPLINRGVTNFFNNVGEISSFFNKIMQGKPRSAARGALRFLVNSTLGFFGLFDVASRIGLPYEYEDFDQTLAVWGVPRGPYVVLPFFGPSSVRGALSVIANTFMDPINFLPIDPLWMLGLRAVKVIDQRADLLALDSVLTGDEYEFFKNAYLQRRDDLIRDGAVEDTFLDDEF